MQSRRLCASSDGDINMARNQFGVICDICGSMSKNSKEFYRLTLPTYESNMNNAVSHKDFCFSCYKELKELLNKTYIKEHSKEATYNAE